ncbi:hypothetical protein OIDMADRAFT_21656 [Oidiodendron maius Zn]|uniref:Uncharacterized protein n=1 Tax=Oidiodendron maius (strain Zn) TaxID=913774 RepID=A0A0C3GQN3_OIDMZ|nr:hypothetical protein OIDMADRAFT_21656 [Oidiodendron maius Zn]
MASGLTSKISASSGSLQGLDAVEASYTDEAGRIYGYIFKREDILRCRFEVDTSTRSTALLSSTYNIFFTYLGPSLSSSERYFSLPTARLAALMPL